MVADSLVGVRVVRVDMHVGIVEMGDAMKQKVADVLGDCMRLAHWERAGTVMSRSVTRRWPIHRTLGGATARTPGEVATAVSMRSTIEGSTASMSR